MKRYFLNKINKISNNLNKTYIKPKPMLLVREYQDNFISSVLSENEIIKKVFKNKNKLDEFIKENDINFIVYGVDLDFI